LRVEIANGSPQTQEPKRRPLLANRMIGPIKEFMASGESLRIRSIGDSYDLFMLNE
jgi:hypothetical protein